MIKPRVSLTPIQSRRVSLLLTILAVFLWSHSIIYARFDIGHWGLISGLPVTFFAALALLTVASAILWVSKERHGRLLCLQLLILILALGLVPLITGGSAPFTDHSYRNLGFVDYIVSQGHFDTQVTWYLSWPGAFVLSAMTANIGSIDFAPLVEIIRFFMPILFLLPLYIFLKNTLGESRSNYVWAGCWLFYLASWGGPANLTSAMGLATFFFIIVLALITSPRLWQKDTRSLALLSLILITFAAMVTSHLLTSLAGFGIIAALSLVRLDKRFVLTAAVCLAILLAWNLTVAWDFMKYRIPFISGGSFIFDLSVITESEVTSHLSGSSSHADVARIKLLHGSLFALIGLAGLISALVKRKDLRTTIFLLAITAIPLTLVVLAGHYGREILTRIYAFVLPGLAYFGTLLFATSKRVVVTVLCLLFIMAVPLNIIATYGNQELDYFSPGQRAGTFFFHDKSLQGLTFGGMPIGTVKNIERYYRLSLDNLKWDDNQLAVPGRLRQYLPYYISISRQDRAWYEWFMDDTQFIGETEQQLQSAANYNFIYNNPDLKLYIYEGE